MDYKIYHSVDEINKTRYSKNRMAATVSAIETNSIPVLGKYHVEVHTPKSFAGIGFQSIDEAVKFLGEEYASYLCVDADAAPNALSFDIIGTGRKTVMPDNNFLHLYFNQIPKTDDQNEKKSLMPPFFRPFSDSELSEFERRLSRYKLAMPGKASYGFRSRASPVNQEVDSGPMSYLREFRMGYKLGERLSQEIASKKTSPDPKLVLLASEFYSAVKGVIDSRVRMENFGVFLYSLMHPSETKKIDEFLRMVDERSTGRSRY
jgi:hypothetical protein